MYNVQGSTDQRHVSTRAEQEKTETQWPEVTYKGWTVVWGFLPSRHGEKNI